DHHRTTRWPLAAVAARRVAGDPGDAPPVDAGGGEDQARTDPIPERVVERRAHRHAARPDDRSHPHPGRPRDVRHRPRLRRPHAPHPRQRRADAVAAADPEERRLLLRGTAGDAARDGDRGGDQPAARRDSQPGAVRPRHRARVLRPGSGRALVVDRGPHRADHAALPFGFRRQEQPRQLLLGVVRPQRDAVLGSAGDAAGGSTALPTAGREPGERGLRVLAGEHLGVRGDARRAGVLRLLLPRAAGVQAGVDPPPRRPLRGATRPVPAPVRGGPPRGIAGGRHPGLLRHRLRGRGDARGLGPRRPGAHPTRPGRRRL
ncbi:MAG: Ava_C0101 and related proteins, partial [uncultured Thermomicrobiales bacterium]